MSYTTAAFLRKERLVNTSIYACIEVLDLSSPSPRGWRQAAVFRECRVQSLPDETSGGLDVGRPQKVTNRAVEML